MDRRQDTKTRKIFDKVVIDLKDILSCYDKKYHYQVIISYLDVYDIFKGNNAIRGRILYILGNL